MGITLQRAHLVWSPDAKSFAMGMLSALGEQISYTFLPHVKPDSVSCDVCPSAQALPFVIPQSKSKLVPTSNYKIFEQFQCLPGLLHGEPFQICKFFQRP